MYIRKLCDDNMKIWVFRAGPGEMKVLLDGRVGRSPTGPGRLKYYVNT